MSAMLSAVFQAMLFVFGLVWCKEIFDRFRSDVACLKESRTITEKVVIVFYWVLTVGVLALIIRFSIHIVASIVESL